MNIDHLVDIVKTAKEISTILKTAKILNNNKLNENILHKMKKRNEYYKKNGKK